MSNESPVSVPAGMLKLVSGDGFSFYVQETCAAVSPVIHAMMNGPFVESKTRVVNLPDISGCVLEKICRYFYYIPRFHSRRRASWSGRKSDLTSMPPLESFLENLDLPPQQIVELMQGAQYLDL